MSNPAAESNEAPTISEIKPCKHMEGLVSSLSDQSLHGPALWYTKFHVATCKHCSSALTALHSLRARLSQLTRGAGLETLGLKADRRELVNQALDRIDQDREAGAGV